MQALEMHSGRSLIKIISGPRMLPLESQAAQQVKRVSLPLQHYTIVMYMKFISVVSNESQVYSIPKFDYLILD